MIAEYKLIKLYAGVTGVVTPGWIIDGGYFKDPDNHTMIGTVLPENEREYYVPDTVKYLTKSELIERVLDIHERHPTSIQLDTVFIDMTSAEITDRVNIWCEARGQE